MLRFLFRIIWNALSLVLIILGIWWVSNNYTTLLGQSFPLPNATPVVVSKNMVLEAVGNVNKQIFIEHYNAVDLTYEAGVDGWLGQLGLKREVLVIIKGRVPAGFDLSELGTDDVWISNDGKRVQMELPAPKVFAENVTIDFENSRTFAQRDSCPDFICGDSLDAYQDIVIPQAKDWLIEASHQNGILEQAARDGRTYYIQILRSLDFEEVRVCVNGYQCD